MKRTYKEFGIDILTGLFVTAALIWKRSPRWVGRKIKKYRKVFDL